MIWTKPVKSSYIHIIAAGGGGGGGSGRVASAARAAGGGGGGGSGAHISLLIPSIFCPETLYITLGAGGNGALGVSVAGSNGNIGTSGEATTVRISQENIAANTLTSCPGGANGGGGTTTAGAAGSAVAGGVITTAFLNRLLFKGMTLANNIVSMAGDTGTAGGLNRATGAANAIDASSGRFILGGTGGGGIGDNGDTSYAGGAHTSGSQAMPFGLAGGAGGSATNGLPGNTGIVARTHAGFFVLGGTGGATTGGVAGALSGAGGDGILGGGGGGSGSAFIGSSSAAGGRGGDGFVLITAL